MGSGAAESVLPVKMADWVPIVASEAYQKGITYTSASGQVIANLGSRTLEGLTNEGMAVTAEHQVCEVNKALTAVSRVTKAGNKVVFEEYGGYIFNYATESITPIRLENGVYMWDIWVAAPAERVQEGFARPSEK